MHVRNYSGHKVFIALTNNGPRMFTKAKSQRIFRIKKCFYTTSFDFLGQIYFLEFAIGNTGINNTLPADNRFYFYKHD
jgi:hypothetical protein